MVTNGTDLKLTATQIKALAGPPLSNSFQYEDRLYRDYKTYDSVYLRPDIDLWAMRRMLAEDGNPRKLEQVLTLPIRSANWELKGGVPSAAALVADTFEPLIDTVIDQCTSGFAYRKAYFECTWKLDGSRVVYDQVLLRPAVSCEARFHAVTGDPDGFRQRIAPIMIPALLNRASSSLGWFDIPAAKAFIYTYGTHREPINGISDLDVSLRCWDNIKKLEFLWCQYLEQQSLPKVFVYGDDDTQAQTNATMLAEANASAAIPVRRHTDPGIRMFDVLESSGRGADQFQKAILYFESMQTQSVLASFTDLAQNASMSNAGSNALSADQSEFYLASCQAKADEMALQITNGLIERLVTYNLGPDVAAPALHFLPIGNKQTDRALLLLNTVVSSHHPTVPYEFTGFLLNQVSTALGLDTDQVSGVVTRWASDMQRQMQAAYAAQVAATETPIPIPGPARQQPVPGVREAEQAAQLAAAIDVATELELSATQGRDPTDTLNVMKAPARHPRKRGRR